MKVLDRVLISYDSQDENLKARWDLNNWANDPMEKDLYWDDAEGDAINLQDSPFKLIEIELDLDKLECTFVAKETT